MAYWQEKSLPVTGGSAGLGRALAKAFAERGAKVIIAARDEERLNQVASAESAGGRTVVGHVADVTNDEQVEALVARAVEIHGRLDCLVNCAGRSTRSEALATTPEEFSVLWDLNFLSVVRCTRAAAPHLLASRGHLVNIGSLAGKTVSRYLGAYPASKFAVSAYTQQLRYELGPQGVHVLLVCPGPIRRDDASPRYEQESAGLPSAAHRPGGGVKLAALDPNRLAAQILRACERRKPELVRPRKARLLLALAQLSPVLGDWIVSRFRSEWARRSRSMNAITKVATLVTYGLFGALFIVAGKTILLYNSGFLPGSWNAAILAEAGGNLDTLHVGQELGSLLVFAGLVSFWFLWQYERSQAFHWSLTAFWAILALVHWFDVRGPNPSIVGPLITTLPFLIFVVLGILRMATQRSRSTNRGAQIWAP